MAPSPVRIELTTVVADPALLVFMALNAYLPIVLPSSIAQAGPKLSPMLLAIPVA